MLNVTLIDGFNDLLTEQLEEFHAIVRAGRHLTLAEDLAIFIPNLPWTYVPLGVTLYQLQLGSKFIALVGDSIEKSI